MFVCTREVSMKSALVPLVALLPLSGCFGPPAPLPTCDPIEVEAVDPLSERVEHYVGGGRVSDLDETIGYFEMKVIAYEKTIRPGANQLLERVYQEGRDFEVTMTRREGGAVFDVVDRDDGYDGTLTFEGAEWDWNTWAYDLNLKEPVGSVTGTGSVTAETLETNKVYEPENPDESSRTRERVCRVDQAAFEDAVKGLGFEP